MSVAFLECSIIIRESWEKHERIECCPQCHKHKQLIYVRPYREGVLGEAGNTDWDLCVEGIVCCNLYHFTRSLPRSWWVEKARELGVYREDMRGYIYPASPHRNTDVEKQQREVADDILQRSGRRIRRSKWRDEDERERLGGLRVFQRRSR